MAVNPVIRFEHIWHALMRVLGPTHFTLRRRNLSIQNDMRQLMGGK